MRQYDTSNLIVHPTTSAESAVIVEVTPELAGWDYINFQVRRLQQGQTWSFATGEHELALVMLSGSVAVESNLGHWPRVGERKDVFSGPPAALFRPRRTTLVVTATSACEFAVAWAATDRDDAPKLIRPADISVEIRGGDNATRQINSIIPPGFACRRLVLVEVYTPGGNWSSFPPHKHDVHNPPAEVDLDEIYYYRINRPKEGFALQRLYSPDLSRDVTVRAQDGDAVLVRSGFHPVVAGPGYDVYYLNFLAGTSRTLAVTEDPNHVWLKSTWKDTDPRLPLVR